MTTTPAPAPRDALAEAGDIGHAGLLATLGLPAPAPPGGDDGAAAALAQLLARRRANGAVFMDGSHNPMPSEIRDAKQFIADLRGTRVNDGNDGQAVLTRHEDGTISLSWPFGRPREVPCTPEALEGMVEQHNALVAEAASARTEVERLTTDQEGGR